jgi:hypothetical protein
MRILVSGSTGLVGTALLEYCATRGHDSVRLVRRKSGFPEPQVLWDPETGHVEQEGLEGFDAVVHLAGENIASGRWTQARKARILSSRVEGTRVLCRALAKLRTPPRTLISASAIGYYGHRGDEALAESSPAGEGFLADLCREWEAATHPAQETGVRVVHLRFGAILSLDGGVLARLLPVFRRGLGGRIGDGRMYMSWVALDDVLDIVAYVLAHDDLAGPINAVAPNPVTNREFTRTLSHALGRPALLPLPAPLVRLAFGEMGREVLLSSARVLPARLRESGFQFKFPVLHHALEHLLDR